MYAFDPGQTHEAARFRRLLSAAATTQTVYAQQLPRPRRVGVLIGTTENDSETRNRVEALNAGLSEAGWIEGRNLHVEFRFTGGNRDRLQRFTKEAADFAPDVVVVHSNDLLAAWRQIDRTTPTVFAQVGDPVGSGFVASLAHPGGNVTGFTTFESDIGGKWPQNLKEIAPATARAMVLLDPNIAANEAYLHAAQPAAPAAGVAVTAAPVQNASEFDNLIATFAKEPAGGQTVSCCRAP